MTTERHDQHLGHLLRDAFRAWEDELAERQVAAGLEGGRARFHPVLRHLDADRPTRLTYLAARSGLTRQAFSAVVDELERLGIVARADAPDDPRVKLLTYTDRGLERFAIARRLMWDMEDDYRERLGDEGYASLRAGLQRLIGT